MDITEFLRPYPEVQVASEKDNAEILDFFNQANLGTAGIQIVYDRSPDFFEFLRLHSSEFFVLIYRAHNKIEGVASYVFRDGALAGRAAKLCYLCDLRIGKDRAASKVWRKLYGEFLENRLQIDQFKAVQRFYTCLMDDNPLSEKNLVRNKRAGFTYHKVSPYSMVTLLSKKPSLLRRKTSIETQQWSIRPSNDLSKLLSFYESFEGSLPCGYFFSKEIPQRLKAWPDLKLPDFLTIQLNSQVVAACALWTPRKAKRILLKNLPWSLKVALRFKKELRVVYVTHLVFATSLTEEQKEHALKMILEEAWRLRKTKGSDFVSFTDFSNASLLKSSHGFFTNRNSMALYEVTSALDPVPESQSTYGFEMALV